MDKFELQKLRDLPIVGVAERLGLQVSRKRAVCPFHADKHPSLSFNIPKNTFRCFVCGANGGTIDLVMRYLRLDFKAACAWLGSPLLLPQRGRDLNPDREDKSSPFWGDKRGAFDPSRYEKFFERPFLNEEANRFLYEVRQLDPRVIRWCRLSSWRDRNGVNWLQIPYFDADGKLIGVQNRNLNYSPPKPGEQAGQPRFLFPNSCQCSIYNLPMLRRLKPDDECWIAEGSSDTWSHMSDHHKVIAIASATLLSPKDKALLQEVTAQLSIRWRMAPDNDGPGRKLAAQLTEILPMLDIVELPEGVKDYSDFYLWKKSQLTNDNGV